MQKLVHHLPWLSGGRAPDARVRARVEQLTGVDLSRVRVHSTSAAGALSDALGARALTMGAHVAFAHDEYRPGTPAGDTLLAHELAHAAQQARGDTASLTGLGGSTARREQLEREAGEVGRHSADGGAAPRWSAAARASRTAASGMPAAPAVQLAPKPDAAASPVSTPLPPAVDDWPNFVDNLAERVNANVFTGYYNITWGKPPDEIEVNVRGDATELYEGPANTMIALNEVHADLAAARKAVADAHELTEHGFVVYTYYRGPGGSIVPTLYSPRSTPNIYAAMMKAITERRAQAGESAEALKGVAIGIAGGIVLRGVLGRVMRWGTGPVKSPTTTTTTLDEPVPSTGKGPSTTSTGNVAPVEVEGVGGAKVEPVKVEPVKVEPVKVPQTTGGEPEGLGVKTGEPVKAAVKEPVKAPVKTPTEEPVVAPYRPCFLAGTEVQAGGRVIPIEEVAVGDAVLGWSTRDDAAPATHRVCALHRGRTRTVMRIGVHGTSIHCTRAHLFHLPSRGWVPAMELRVGDALTDSGTGSPIVEEVERLTLAGDTDTFDLTVDGVSTYFVRAGTSWVLVHNGGPGDFGGPLYWIFGKKPNLRPGDVDGLSSFKTTSVAEVEILMDHRVNVSGRPVGDPHFCLTEAEVQSAGLVAPQTPSVDPLAAKLPHHSLRPAEAPAYPHELTPPEMTQLGTKLNTLPRTIIKPSQIRC